MNYSNNGLQDYNAIQLNHSGDNLLEWASELFEDSDGTDWLRSSNNLLKLQNEADVCNKKNFTKEAITHRITQQ